MTQPDNPNDFVSPNSQPNQGSTPSGSKALPVVLIIAGVGCGCLGLVIFLGILMAIALPSFLNQANKVRRSEAEQIVGSLVRAQQAYRSDTGSFAQSIPATGAAIPTKTSLYQYEILKKGDPKQSVFITAQPLQPNIRSYIGAVFVIEKNTTISEICKSSTPQVAPPNLPTLSRNKTRIECPSGSQAVMKK